MLVLIHLPRVQLLSRTMRQPGVSMRARMKPRSIMSRPSSELPPARPPRSRHISISTTKSHAQDTEPSGMARIHVSQVPSATLPDPSQPIQESRPIPFASTLSSQVTPSGPSSGIRPPTQSQYHAIVEEILSTAPSAIREKYQRLRDPRILFPHVPDAARKKVLSDWLDDNYFIPKEIFTPGAPNEEQVEVRLPTARTTETWQNHPSRTLTSTSPIPNPKAQTTSSERVPLPEAMDDLVKALPSLSLGTMEPVTRQSTAVPQGPHVEEKSAFQSLLEVSRQTTPYDFDAFVNTFALDELHDRSRGTKPKRSLSTPDLVWRKVGEASYSEVFSVGEVVLKIVPLEYHDAQSQGAATMNVDDKHPVDKRGRRKSQPRPSTSDPQDVLREVNATRILGNVHRGFMRLLR